MTKEQVIKWIKKTNPPKLNSEKRWYFDEWKKSVTAKQMVEEITAETDFGKHIQEQIQKFLNEKGIT
ncbi:TPA_asm: hypothetical protein vir519_00053 [Caudoviricetes sp. vir519]|nr:TPA_asm: hypothetical protein vir519_00053 [Caudoviricetes sp. vir519]